MVRRWRQGDLKGVAPGRLSGAGATSKGGRESYSAVAVAVARTTSIVPVAVVKGGSGRRGGGLHRSRRRGRGGRRGRRGGHRARGIPVGIRGHHGLDREPLVADALTIHVAWPLVTDEGVERPLVVGHLPRSVRAERDADRAWQLRIGRCRRRPFGEKQRVPLLAD